MNHSVTRVLYEAVTLCELSEESDFDNRTRTTVHDFCMYFQTTEMVDS